MIKPQITTFNQLAQISIQYYNSVLPNAFDESFTILEKMNKLIEHLNQMGVLNNKLVKQWNDIMRWITEEGIEDAVKERLDQMTADGTFNELIQSSVFKDFNNRLIAAENNIKTVNADIKELNKDRRSIGVTARSLGIVYNGDETAKLQEVINYAGDNNIPIHFEDKAIRTSGLVIDRYTVIEGNLNLEPVENNQEYMVRLKSKVSVNGRLFIDGKKQALYGIVGSSFGRSEFRSLEVNRCRIWGHEYLPSGNNNMVRYQNERYEGNGTRLTSNFTQASTTNISSVTGYSTITLGTPINNIFLKEYAIKFIIVNGNAYRVKAVNSGNNLEVYHLDIGDGNTSTATIIIGGGLNINKHGDNGVGYHENIDIFSNEGIGMHHSPMYAHVFSNYVSQGNALGYATDDYTFGLVMTNPYFELNLIDVVIYNYVEGTIISPILNVNNIQSILNRKINNGLNLLDNRLKIIKGTHYNITSDLPSMDNSGARNITPGHFYAIRRSTGNQAMTINNNVEYTMTNSNFINLDISSPTPSSFTFNLKNAGDTIEGASSFTVNVKGNVIIRVFKVGTDWKVNVFRTNVTDSVNYVPTFKGEVAIVGTAVYMAVGTSSTADWIKLSNV